MNEETAKVKIDAMQEIVRAIARAEAEKVVRGERTPAISLRNRVAELEKAVGELKALRDAQAKYTFGVDLATSGESRTAISYFDTVTGKYTVQGQPKYIRILPHGDPGADLPVGTVADYAMGIGSPRVFRVTKGEYGKWIGTDRRDNFFAGSGVLSIISIPEPKPRDIDTMSIDDCRDELAYKAGHCRIRDFSGNWLSPNKADRQHFHPIPNTPEEQRKLPEGWRLTGLYETASQWKAIAEHVSGQTQSYRGPNRDLAEWRLRVACERAGKSQ